MVKWNAGAGIPTRNITIEGHLAEPELYPLTPPPATYMNGNSYDDQFAYQKKLMLITTVQILPAYSVSNG
jgi:hypothetical protein